MANTKIPVELSSTPGIVDGSNATAITIDSSERVGIGTSSPSAPLTVSTTGSGDAVIIESTEAGSSNAPDLVLHRNSASPADDDSLGIIRFRGKNDASEAIDLINIFGQVTDVSDGSEDSTLYFKTYKDGAEQSPLTLAGSNVGIATTSPAEKLEIAGNIFVNTSGNPNLTVKTSGAGNNPYVRIQADTNYWDLQTLFSNANDELDFRYNGTSTLKIDNAGHVTKPLQPYFLAYRSGNQAGFNSAGNYGAVVEYNAEIEDINGDFNTSNGLFTAPVDGTYWFIASAYGSSFQQAWLAINTGSGASRATYTDFNVGGYSGDVFTAVFYVNLDANDTVGYHPYTSTSTNVTIIANAYHTWFKGGLLY